MPTLPIYLDNNATTRLDPIVLEAMLPFLTENYGNSSSTSHVFGQIAEKAVMEAREKVAGLLKCKPQEIYYTSGATESNNIAILGAMRAFPAGSQLIITSAEHKAVIDPAQQLSSEGYVIRVLPVDKYGRVSAEQVASQLSENTALVSVIHGNNEVGSLNPIFEIAAICKSRDVLFHTDATQTAGKIPIDLSRCEIDMLSLSAHKMYGPKGIGAFFIRRRFPKLNIQPLVFGGGHEKQLRSGTLPVHQIVGLGMACSLCESQQSSESQRISRLRELLKLELSRKVPDIHFNGHPEKRLPGNLHISVPGANSEAVMMKLRNQLAFSSGSACTMSSPEPSHVLKAIGLKESFLTTSMRFGVGRFNTEPEVLNAGELLSTVIEATRQLSGYRKMQESSAQDA